MLRPLDAPPLRAFWGGAKERGLARRYWIDETVHGVGRLALHHGMRALPMDAASAVGDFVGRRLARPAMPEEARRARDNWRRLRPQDADRAEAAAAFAFGQTGRVHWEFAALDRLQRRNRIRIDGGEHIATARAAGRPVLVIGLHLSNWEVIGPALTQLGHPVTAIYQPPPNRFDHRVVVAARRRWGCELLPPNASGARAAYRTLLERQRVLVIYVDECIDEHVYAPFFGRPLKPEGNIARAARLAAMTGAVLIPCYVLRDGGADFQVTFLPPLDLAHDGKRDPAADVARINDVIEPVVRRHLDQWFWLFDLRLDGAA
jgi:KDO2-lipid IV(A) lauroyltransferase